MSEDLPKRRDRKAYLRAWYLRNREKEVASALARKREKLVSMNAMEYALYAQARRKEGKITRLRRDLKRACDPDFDATYRQKKAAQSAEYRAAVKADPERLAKQREVKKLAMRRRRAGVKGSPSKTATVGKVKKVMPVKKPGVRVCRKFAAAQKFAQIVTGLTLDVQAVRWG
jgi:hypothetical protein